MKIQIEKKDLTKLISKVAKASAVLDTIPVLQCVLLEAKDGRLVAKASNLEVSIKDATSEIQINEPGEVMVNARHLDKLVSQLPEGVISLEVEENVLLVKYGRSKAKVPVITGEYPEAQACETLVGEYKVEEVKKALNMVSSSVAKQHFRPVFTGVLLDIKEDKTTFVASDTHRMATYEVPCGGELRQLIVPVNGLREAIRTDEETVAIFTNGNVVKFRAGELEVTSRLIGGTYPDYARVIPTDFVCEVKLPEKDARQALLRLGTLPGENKNIPVAKLNINGNLVLSSTGTGGEITEVLEPEKTGDDLIISFNRDYLLDAVKCIGTENLHIGFSGASTPAKFFGDSGQITVVPLRTN
ncbi:MAG: DNA polymerase III subunit beta [Ruminiclostridium sp.]|nr:DNA polymerase III subunit beta [Ruminiclostridium sp.]